MLNNKYIPLKDHQITSQNLYKIGDVSYRDTEQIGNLRKICIGIKQCSQQID